MEKFGTYSEYKEDGSKAKFFMIVKGGWESQDGIAEQL